MPRTHTVDIESLERFTEQIGSRSRYFIQDFAGSLFHYTDLAALKSILKEGDLWLSNARYSNDEKEMSHGYEVAHEVIRTKRKRSRSKARRKYYDRVLALIEEKRPEGVYICCFCTRDNLLSQWLAYGDDGTGVSIGFDPNGFASVSGPDLPLDTVGLMRLWKVFYEPEQQREILLSALDLIPELNPGDSEELKARKAADAINFFMPTFKNVDFEGEKERRLIFTPSPKCEVSPGFRVARGMLIPYYSLRQLSEKSPVGNQPLPLTRVTVGPSVRKGLNVEAVRMLLEQAHHDVDVTASETPYRG